MLVKGNFLEEDVFGSLLIFINVGGVDLLVGEGDLGGVLRVIVILDYFDNF